MRSCARLAAVECSGIGNDLWPLRLEEVIAWKICEDLAITKQNDAVSEVERFVQIVSYE